MLTLSDRSHPVFLRPQMMVILLLMPMRPLAQLRWVVSVLKVPGLMAMTVLFSSTFSSASYYQDRGSGLLRAMMASPHPQQVILLGKSLAGVVIGSLQAIALLLIAAAIPGVDLEWLAQMAAGTKWWIMLLR